MDAAWIAAGAALGALVVGAIALYMQFHWRRPCLFAELENPNRRDPGTPRDSIVFVVRVRNDGETILKNVRCRALVAGDEFATAGPITLSPGSG